MTTVWLIVLSVGVVSTALKAAGPVILGGRTMPATAQRVIALLAPTLLAALIATQAFGRGHSLTVDTRVVGMGVGFGGMALKLPTLLVVVLAAAATALTRMLV